MSLKDQIIEGNIAIQKQQNEQQQILREQMLVNESARRETLLKNEQLKKELETTKNELDFYKNLLKKPMREIANHDQNFLETYHEQQTILGSWILNQRAYKEIAIKLGLEAGISKEDIIKKANETKETVLNNETEHDNNFNQNEWETFYSPRVKIKMGIN